MTLPFRMHATPRRLALAVLLSAATVGCASSGSTEKTDAKPSGSSRYLIVEADLEKVKADNVYDAINKLRPDFLRGRGENSSFVQQSIPGSQSQSSAAPLSSSTGNAAVTSTAPVMVYKDNVKMGGVDDLRSLQLATVREIRFLTGPEAVIRFGSNHIGGAILITSK